MSVSLALTLTAIAVLVAELVLSWRWSRFYYTVGLPVFIRTVETLGPLQSLSLPDLARSTASAVGTPYVFQPLGPDAIAFREAGGFFHYTPAMRGVIRRREGEPVIQVVGFANWTMIVTIAFLVLAL
ncbi:MAG: hypothetical protein JOZ54_18320 [Acidobacteria bacterium]|nr:hypothetical protein [Acidobacteriota bacterium]